MSTQFDVEAAIRSAVQGSDGFWWSDDWQEPALANLPVVTARPMGFQPEGGKFREVWEVRMVLGPSRRQLTSHLGPDLTSKTIMQVLRSLIYDVLEPTGCYPRLRAAPISYATVLGKREFVTATVLVLA